MVGYNRLHCEAAKASCYARCCLWCSCTGFRGCMVWDCTHLVLFAHYTPRNQLVSRIGQSDLAIGLKFKNQIFFKLAIYITTATFDWSKHCSVWVQLLSRDDLLSAIIVSVRCLKMKLNEETRYKKKSTSEIYCCWRRVRVSETLSRCKKGWPVQLLYFIRGFYDPSVKKHTGFGSISEIWNTDTAGLVILTMLVPNVRCKTV